MRKYTWHKIRFLKILTTAIKVKNFQCVGVSGRAGLAQNTHVGIWANPPVRRQHWKHKQQKYVQNFQDINKRILVIDKSRRCQKNINKDQLWNIVSHELIKITVHECEIETSLNRSYSAKINSRAANKWQKNHSGFWRKFDCCFDKGTPRPFS